MSFPDALDGWTTGNGGATVLHTADGGATWTPQTVDPAAALRSVRFCDAQHGWAVGQAGEIYGTTDGGQSWQPQGAGATTQVLDDVATTDAQHAWATGEDGTIVATTDGGQTWTPQNANLPTLYSTDVVYKVAFADDQVGWAAAFNDAAGDRDGAILGTTDGGAHWAVQYQNDGDEIYGVACAGTHDAWVVSGTDGTVHRTTDGGATWTTVGLGALSNGVLNVAFAPDALHGWATIWRPLDCVIATTDGGATWALQDVGAGQSLYGLTCADASHAWVTGEDGGILATATGGVRDATRPKTLALRVVTVRRDRVCSLPYEVSDAGGGTALVVIEIKTAHGALVRSFTLGSRAENTRLSLSLKATMAKGSYRWYVYASDAAGNTQSSVGTAKLTVK